VSALKAVAILDAVKYDRAQRLTTVRHTRIHERPFVFIPLAMAGEACAPLAALCGTDRDDPTFLLVPQPRNRDQRFAFVAELAERMLDYFQSCCHTTEAIPRGKEDVDCYTDAPQILVPSQPGIDFTRLLGRSTRLRTPTGPWAVHDSVPTLGKWLTWLGDQSEFPGSSLLLAMTNLLGAHWATGQSNTEDANLAALLAWITPPTGMGGAAAAMQAEDPSHTPPAGPATDPDFDRSLSELIDAHEAADNETKKAATLRVLEGELRTQLDPTWALMWEGIDRLRELPESASVAKRWEFDRALFTGYAEYLETDGWPQARRDNAAKAARRLARLEAAATKYQSERAFDDPLVMAEYELIGEAFSGVVVGRDPERTVPGKKAPLFRPTITLIVDDAPRLAVGSDVTSPTRPGQPASILDVQESTFGFEVVIELQGGFQKARKPPAPPGTIPEIDEELCYTTLGKFISSAALPEEGDTPWTHGGPPTPYEPTDEDAEEAWA
jgi:hypothetical protein